MSGFGYCQCGCGMPTPIASRTYGSKGIVKGMPVTYCVGHGTRGRWSDPRELLLERRLIDGDGCWNYTGYKENGYGRMMVTARGRVAWVHRLSYEVFVGPIPDGLHIDHLCRNRACFNPDHLEPVTQQENARRAGPWMRKTHCKRGHELTEGNLYVSPGGVRRCRICRDRSREAQERRRRELVS